jgi:RHH-type rel operon transcriptional repressor/antitoxin RelB
MLAIRLPADIEARLDRLAKETGRTKSYYVREAIIEQLSNLENIHLAEKAYGEYLADPSSAKSIDEVAAEYGL